MDDQAHLQGELEAVLAELALLGHTVRYYGAALAAAEPHDVGEDLRRAGYRIIALVRPATELAAAFRDSLEPIPVAVAGRHAETDVTLPLVRLAVTGEVEQTGSRYTSGPAGEDGPPEDA